jgi:exosortase
MAAGPEKTQSADDKIVDPGKNSTLGAMSKSYWIVSTATAIALFIWMYRNTISDLFVAWQSEDDYSHGFLVPPFALLMLWVRRESLPRNSAIPGWGGLTLLVIAAVLRFAGARLFLAPLAGWSLMLWLGGIVWILAGWRAFVWAGPALLFLFFMIPLPFRIEQLLSWQLQSITTKMSAFILECLCFPAIPEGHTLYVGDQVLEVEQACSGLRMFIGIAAVAFAMIVLQRRPWWENLMMAACVAPVAMLSNAMRVVITAIALGMTTTEAGAKLVHDAAGWVMIVIATVLFSVLTAFLRRLAMPVNVSDGSELLRSTVTS